MVIVMFQIQTLNKIAACGTDRFDKEKYTVANECGAPDGIMVRSAAMHEMATGFPQGDCPRRRRRE